MLKVSPWKGEVRLSKRGKLNPSYVGPSKVMEKVGSVDYKLELPQELNRVHNTFHVSNLKKCYADEPLVVSLDGLYFDNKLQFVKEPILSCQIQRIPQSPTRWYPIHLEAPPSPDYVLGLKEPEQAPPLPEFVPEMVYPEFMPPKDDALPTEEQPLPAAISPTADSPGYIPESDPKEDPEEDDDEDHEEDPADYPTDRDDDDDEEEDEPSRDKADDEKEDEDDEGEEEHLPPADSTTVAFPAVDHVPSAEETQPFETDKSAATPPPHPTYRVARLLVIPTPPPSLLSPWSSPLPQIASPPLPVSPPSPISPPPLPTSPTYPLGYRAVMIRLRVETPSTSHLLQPHIVLPHNRASVAMMRVVALSTYILAPRLRMLPLETPSSRTPPLLPIPLPTPSPPLLLPFTDCRAGVSEATLSPRKRLCIALGLRYEVGESSYAFTARPIRGCRAYYGFVGTLDDEIRRDPERYVGYGITDTWEDMVEDVQGTPVVTDVAELSQRMTDFVTNVRQDTNEIYGRLDDAQDDRLLMSSRLNTLFRDRRAHTHTALLIEREVRLSREAWGRSIDASDLAIRGYGITYSGGSTSVRDYSLASSRPRSAGITCGDTKTDEYTRNTGDSTVGTAGTRWRSSTAKDTRGGW
ncbi:hypothetical protein Tco_0366326 [Tanacetum coccineum]